MRRESANYSLAVPRGAEVPLLETLYRSGAEQLRADDDFLDYCLRDRARYWIDLRIHRRPQQRLELRIALTNDTWSIRVPLQRALTPLPESMVGQPVLDDRGARVTVAGGERWWYAIEEDYGRLRDEFISVFGDITAPISVDHVYLYVHHERRRRDAVEAAWEWRAVEIDMLERIWEEDPPPPEEIPPSEADPPPDAGAS
jgi:hypothetical protein